MEDYSKAGVKEASAALQHITTHRNTPQHTAPYCNTLQHTATQVSLVLEDYSKAGVKEANAALKATNLSSLTFMQGAF